MTGPTHPWRRKRTCTDCECDVLGKETGPPLCPECRRLRANAQARATGPRRHRAGLCGRCGMAMPHGDKRQNCAPCYQAMNGRAKRGAVQP